MTSSCHLPSVLPQLPQFQLPSLAHVTFPFFYLVPDKLPYCLLKPALSPDPEAGCNFWYPPAPARMECFNPHPTRRPGATQLIEFVAADAGLFQSSPDPEAGCNEIEITGYRERCKVSILTRPGGRVQLLQHNYAALLQKVFQSSPDPEAGCNPKPVKPKLTIDLVSILTRPGGRVQLGNGWRRQLAERVSILTRPGGRVQRFGMRLFSIVRQEFQSSPDPEAGCNPVLADLRYSGMLVSILTRPGGRVQRCIRHDLGEWQHGFQSSPDPEAGCNRRTNSPQYVSDICFNPHPTRRPGATRQHWGNCCVAVGFNPHPTRRPGATMSA